MKKTVAIGAHSQEQLRNDVELLKQNKTEQTLTF
jgi:hypothetical protein